MEKSKTHSSGYSEAIITRIESVEREFYKAYTGVICKKSYELVRFLQSYDVQQEEFSIHSDRSDWTVDNKLIDPF